MGSASALDSLNCAVGGASSGRGEGWAIKDTPLAPETVGQLDDFAGSVMAVGGAAYLVSKAIRSSKVLAFEDLGMVGKAERGPAAIEAIRDNQAVYLMAVGGAAYLVSKAIKSSRVLAFEDLGMEAIYEFDVVDMPVTVAVDAQGTSVHNTGPAEWQARIAQSLPGTAVLQ